MSERFVVLGLAGSRARWFADVGQWAHAGSIPIEFIKCVSVEQLRARLHAGRAHSAALLDGQATGVDRDALHDVHDAGVAAIVVDAHRDASHWHALGADAVLAGVFGPNDLLDALRVHAAIVPTTEWQPPSPDAAFPTATGRVCAVCGPGGTGVSTVAAALAQQYAAKRVRSVLVDLCRHAEQGMLHDTGDVGPGIQELVDACRTTAPPEDQVRAHAYAVVERGYALLLGLRRPTAWSSLRPRAASTALACLRSAFDVTVCDSDADLEGHDGGGSWDVEERNALARAAFTTADVVVAVGNPGVKGVHSLGRVISELGAFGVDPARIVPVFNRAGRGRANRKLSNALLATLPSAIERDLRPPVFVPERELEDALRDRRRLPAALGEPVLVAVERAQLTRPSTVAWIEPHARPIAPGELATWPEEISAT